MIVYGPVSLDECDRNERTPEHPEESPVLGFATRSRSFREEMPVE